MCERKILLGWLDLELVAGVVREENTVGLELELAAEQSDCGSDYRSSIFEEAPVFMFEKDLPCLYIQHVPHAQKRQL